MINITPQQVKTGSTTQRGIQFLKPLHCTTNPVAVITKVTTDKADNFGNPYVVYFEFGGQKYSKGYSPNSDALRQLVAFFGSDETKWKGKKVTLGVQVIDDQERITYAKA